MLRNPKGGGTKISLWGQGFRKLVTWLRDSVLRSSGGMPFHCLFTKRPFLLCIYIGDESTLVAFLVLKCLCLLFWVLSWYICKDA